MVANISDGRRVQAANSDGAARAASDVPRYRAADLLAGRPWIVIEHGAVEYRLHVTRLGKLILTK